MSDVQPENSGKPGEPAKPAPVPPVDWRALERTRVATRRAVLGAGMVEPPREGGGDGHGDGHGAGAARPLTTGLALSGGGIRSATVSLGMLQVLARRDTLKQFDYVSTVSGGGYTGAFLCSLFTPDAVREGRPGTPGTPDEAALRAAAFRAHATLAATERRAGSEPESPAAKPLAWLRDSGRYLAPNGGGDYLFAFSLWLRNLLAVHYVLGTTIAGLLVVLGLLNHLLAPQLLGLLAPHLPDAWQAALAPGAIWRAGLIYAVAGVAVFALGALPVGVSYWYTEPPRDPQGGFWAGLTTTTAVIGFLMGPVLALAWWGWRHTVPQVLPEAREVATHAIIMAVAALLVLASGWYIAAWLRTWSQDRAGRCVTWTLVTRTRVTRWLSWAIGITLGLAAVAAVLVASRALAGWVSQNPMEGASGAGVLAALMGLWKLLLGRIGGANGEKTRRLAVQWLPLLAAVVLGLLLVLAWGLAAAVLIGQDTAEVSWFTVLALGALGLITGRTFQFLNLSTIQNLYTARIVRAYLGATNAGRALEPRWQNVTEPHPHDDLSLDQYYGRATADAAQPASLAPLHVINVTINETVAARGTLVQQDRKGRPLAITPDGFLVDGEFVTRDVARRPPGAFFEGLSVGRWVGISGAAFAPGLGRHTRPELSLLTVLANVRLGFWWRAHMLAERARRRARGVLFSTQAHLLQELRGRFWGTDDSHWYLSDGGHFENTAVYELLRRRVDFVLALDNGADPDYGFRDIANLMRLALVDFGARFVPLAPQRLQEVLERRHGSAGGQLAALFGNPGGFARELREGQHFLIAFQVELPVTAELPPHTTTLVFVKPRLTQNASLDLVQYQATHPAFPQEPTADQFFDDEQWESYRKLGASMGEALLGQGISLEELVLALRG